MASTNLQNLRSAALKTLKGSAGKYLEAKLLPNILPSISLTRKKE